MSTTRSNLFEPRLLVGHVGLPFMLLSLPSTLHGQQSCQLFREPVDCSESLSRAWSVSSSSSEALRRARQRFCPLRDKNNAGARVHTASPHTVASRCRLDSQLHNIRKRSSYVNMFACKQLETGGEDHLLPSRNQDLQQT